MKNILIILTDQQRKDSLGCYGNPVCRTPNLDRLAAGGVRFERNYVANPICMPNRLSLFTGKNIRNHGLWTNGLLIPEQPTVAGHFRDHGYQTASIGKIHFTPYGGEGGNLESEAFWRQPENRDASWTGPYWGFEHVELTLGHTQPLAHYGKWFYDHGGTDAMLKIHPVTERSDSGVRDLPEELHDSTFVAERAIDYIKNRRDPDQPFFLVASFPDPHHPFNPPAESAENYADADIVPPVGGPEDLASRPEHYQQHFRGEWHRSGLHEARHPKGISNELSDEKIRHTYAMVDLIDRQVGKIIAALDQQGLREDTIVVFTSDHGELLGDHGLWYKGPFFYEGLVNTPLIMSNPGSIEPAVSQTLFSDLDLAPTLCDLAGLDPMPFMDGVSQVPHLRNPRTTVRDQCLIEYHTGYGEHDCSSKVLVTDQFKYVRYQTGEDELTDLWHDREERRNVAADLDYQDIKTRLAGDLLDEILKTEQKGPEQISHA
ncbi:MAG: sulfatase-like hydrolase/transferase [Lentisphaeria bacterium]|nr:sulfatase-like hydrolase/transferase [Lentisphaeria bacterium]